MTFFKHQQWHFLSLLILLSLLYFFHLEGSLYQGSLWSIETKTWFVLAILSPILHQLYVLVCWRLELLHNRFSNKFGDKGFKIFKIGFAILIISRILTITLLAISSADTLEIEPVFSYCLAVLFFLPAAYLAFSVRKYFGIDRAFGKDHFEPEAFKNKPFVKKGIFKYSSNAMYVFGMMMLWVPGFLLLSKAAILVALFNHLYIWIHYYFTELPDIKVIYGN